MKFVKGTWCVFDTIYRVENGNRIPLFAQVCGPGPTVDSTMCTLLFPDHAQHHTCCGDKYLRHLTFDEKNLIESRPIDLLDAIDLKSRKEKLKCQKINQ